jgi:hypothetical protein
MRASGIVSSEALARQVHTVDDVEFAATSAAGAV